MESLDFQVTSFSDFLGPKNSTTTKQTLWIGSKNGFRSWEQIHIFWKVNFESMISFFQGGICDRSLEGSFFLYRIQ